MRYTILRAALAAVLLVPATGAASGPPEGLQARIDAWLAASPGGKQISPNQIAWEGGRVVLTLPSVGVHGSPSCPAGRSCLYEHANWEGAMLSFDTCGFRDMIDYGFIDMTSSWHNNRSTRSYLYNWTGSWTWLWTEQPSTSSAYVGDAHNDRADGWTIAC
ncbi:peptidase inhibitor family I36 protein [Allorhizocola rhizosphaerae]|uniref:peptidase inhibitor family I36 protein n=1 Tax=Allorhizocola rhizosphaerae TaxID=1872709 RepID=UPI000E3E7297|nr:peptidase inhibitor family I36 protein [Allorhizocola rhizosphaerae]